MSTIELFQNEIRKLHYTGLKKEIFMIIESKKFCTSHEQEIGPSSSTPNQIVKVHIGFSWHTSLHSVYYILILDQKKG